jgi:hypothetical protein
MLKEELFADTREDMPLVCKKAQLRPRLLPTHLYAEMKGEMQEFMVCSADVWDYVH